MRTKRNLLLVALGGAAGYILGRYPQESFEKVRSVAGASVGLARERAGTISVAGFPRGRTGDHRSANAQHPKTGDDLIDGTSTAYIDRAHP